MQNQITSLDELKSILPSGNKRKLALVASNDSHCLEAVIRAKNDGLIDPVLIGPENETKRIISELGESIDGYELFDISDPEECAKQAAKMAGDGYVDCIMKGKLQTGELMHVLVSKEYGIRTGSVISGVGLFEIPERTAVLVSDMAMIPTPSLEQKKAITENAVFVMHRLGIDTPKVAVLSAVENVNPKMPGSVDGSELKKMNEDGQITGCVIEGPISYDLAMSRESAELKGYQGKIKGDADVLIVPDISAGNILAKCLCATVKSRNGGILVGTKVPVIVLSRSATADDKYYSILLAAVVGSVSEN